MLKVTTFTATKLEDYLLAVSSVGNVHAHTYTHAHTYRGMVCVSLLVLAPDVMESLWTSGCQSFWLQPLITHILTLAFANTATNASHLSS